MPRPEFRLLLYLTLIVACLPASADTLNVARASNGTVAVADSVYSSDLPDKAIDGKRLAPGEFSGSNRWHAALETPHPHWLWLKFRQPARISRVVIHRADTLGQPVDFVGEYSPDGGFTFRRLFAVEGNRMGPDDFSIERSFTPVTTDNFRLRILRSSNTEHPNYAQISEIGVLGEFAEPKPAREVIAAPAKWPVLLKRTEAPGLTITDRGGDVEFCSNWLRMVLSRSEPRITELCWDSLGKGKVHENLLKPGPDGGAVLASKPLFPGPAGGKSQVEIDGNLVRYTSIMPDGARTRWEIRASAKGIRMAVAGNVSSRSLARSPLALHFAFDVSKTPVSPLANPRPGTAAPLPCLLHATDYGTLLLQSPSKDVNLAGESIRSQAQWNASIEGSAKRRSDGLIVLSPGTTSFEVSAVVESVRPVPALTKSDPRLATLPRHWLNTFQYRPDIGMLANNIVSDNCVFCLYQYADAAVYTPRLPGGVEPIRMVREALDRYFAGATGYGIGWEDIETETYPSMLIAAWDVIRVTGDKALLRKWLPHLNRIAAAMEKQDRNGNGIPESIRTGVSGRIGCPTSNWWDQINFGHEDAYASALAYRALGCFADLQTVAGNRAEAERIERWASRIKAAYVPNFLNPDTGVIAGWRDSEGKLHDYYFTFVNGAAIANGLVPDGLANKIMDRMQAKMRNVGYTRFELGLPGPLIVIPKNDYGVGALGSPQRDDGMDTWEVFEHGGATACFASHYIQALYKLGRRTEADAILWPMMTSYAAGRFQNGVGKGGEWTRWDGSPSGYEGMLADAYATQIVLFTGYYGIGFGPNGFHTEPWSPLKGSKTPLGLMYMGRR